MLNKPQPTTPMADPMIAGGVKYPTLVTIAPASREKRAFASIYATMLTPDAMALSPLTAWNQIGR